MDSDGRQAGPDHNTHYKRAHLRPHRYLAQQRRLLLTTLPSTHQLRQRTQVRTGTLLSSNLHPPSRPRAAFTQDELQSIKFRRRPPYTSDPDDAGLQLQRSQLVQMWNADYDNESQWAEYDAAQGSMSERKEDSGLPEEIFDNEVTVDRKRKRVVSSDYVRPVRRRAWTIEPEETEGGEVVEQGRTGAVLGSIEEENERLREENEQLKAYLGRDGKQRSLSPEPEGLPPSPPASPPEPDAGDSDLEVEIDEHDVGSLDDLAVKNASGDKRTDFILPTCIEEAS